MKRAFVSGLVLILFCVMACTTRKRESQVEKRQSELNQKEQELLLRERSLQLREEELTRREKSIDSSIVRDTALLTHNPALLGTWQVKMTCVETSCTGSAVGDTKTEQWDISYQDNHIIAQATVNDKLVRTYSGLSSGNRIELIQHEDSTMTYDTRMVVRLRLMGNKILEGQREIIRPNDCKIVYSLRMDKL